MTIDANAGTGNHLTRVLTERISNEYVTSPTSGHRKMARKIDSVRSRTVSGQRWPPPLQSINGRVAVPPGPRRGGAVLRPRRRRRRSRTPGRLDRLLGQGPGRRGRRGMRDAGCGMSRNTVVTRIPNPTARSVPVPSFLECPRAGGVRCPACRGPSRSRAGRHQSYLRKSASQGHAPNRPRVVRRSSTEPHTASTATHPPPGRRTVGVVRPGKPIRHLRTRNGRRRSGRRRPSTGRAPCNSVRASRAGVIGTRGGDGDG